MPKIQYKFADGHTEEIEVSAEVAAFLRESEREERDYIRWANQYCVSLELLQNRERRVLQSGRQSRSRDKPYGGEGYVDYTADPHEVIEKYEED